MRPGVLLGLGLALGTGPLAGQTAEDRPLQSILANGYRFGFVEAGQGVPVVLVHGALTDYRFWLGPLAILQGGARVVAYSRRYHYPNPWRAGDPAAGFEISAFDLAAVVRALRLERPVVVGHSWGGTVVLAAALRDPALFGGIILADPLADSLIPDPDLRAAAGRRADEALKEALAHASPREPAVAVQRWFDSDFGAGSWAELDEPARGRLRDNAHLLSALGETQPAFTCGDLARLPMPVLLIGGSESGERARATLDGLARCLPAAARVTIPGAGPLAPRTHPAAFADAVRRFLADLPR